MNGPEWAVGDTNPFQQYVFATVELDKLWPQVRRIIHHLPFSNRCAVPGLVVKSLDTFHMRLWPGEPTFPHVHSSFKFALAGDGNIMATTLSAQLRTGNLTLIPEFRIDAANKEIFTKSDGSSTKTAANVLLAAVYQF